ncbi:sialate O-acetylesterase [Pseudoxanthomonas wuyuanensis]
MSLLSRCAAGALLVFPLCAVSPARAQDNGEAPLLHAMFQDHAVLQRSQPIRVWGRARPGAEVSVAFAGKRARGRAGGDGQWQAQLPALKAGGPYQLIVSTGGGATQIVGDVLVGDVWLCSGQSNMELQVKRTLNSRAEIADADHDSIRLLKVGQKESVVPREDFALPVQWQKTTPENVPEFSAACYYFARELQKTVGVPMGLVNASWGGSRIEAWLSAEALRKVGGYDDALDVLKQYAVEPVAAAASWGGIWTKWWRGQPGAAPGDEPWRADYAPGEGWRAAPRGLGPWEGWGVPELAGFNGMLWYRTTFKLTAAQAAQEAVLALGTVDEIDMTWVNGRGVGSAYIGEKREYPLPRGLLKAGDNTLVVNALDTYASGGITGPASSRALRFADGSSVPLDSGWRYRIVPPAAGVPPLAPWLSASGKTTLYNGMIAPLGRYGFRGALWYQGESNTGESAAYRGLLRAYREDLRTRFGPDLPLLIVQLANYGAAPTRPAESGWAQLREVQRQVAAEDARTGLAVTIDIGDRYDIHPANKQELGRRLARAARHVVYGEKLPPSGSVPLAARREGEAVVVSFGDVSGDLIAYGADGPIGFELCGREAGSCRYADAEIRGNQIVLRAPLPTPATRVRYGWADSPVVTLFDGAGLPAGPFEIPVP